MILSTVLIIILVPLLTAMALGAPWATALKEKLRYGRSNDAPLEAASEVAPEEPSEPPVSKMFAEVMSRLQIYPQSLPDESGEESGCTFDFQGGHFVATFRENAEESFCNTFSISYFACYSLAAEHVSRAGELANSINSLVLPVKCSFTPNAEDGDISFSLHCTGMRLDDSGEQAVEYVRSLLLTFFRLQRLLFERFEEIKSAAPSEVETNRLIFGHQLYALSRMEVTESDDPLTHGAPLWHPAELTVGKFLRIMFDDVVTDDMTLSLDGVQIADNAVEIASTPLLAPVVAGEGADAQLMSDVAFFSLRSKVRESREVLISLRAEKIDDRLITVRVNALASALPVTPFRAPASIENYPDARCVVIGVPCVTPEAFLAEAKYMAEELGLLEKCKNPDAAYCLYWGKLLYTDGRLVEADHYLTNAYSLLSPQMQDTEKVSVATCEVFYEICYFLGVLNCALGRYHKAYYYLDLIVNQHRVMWTEQYVACLVAMRDPRCPSLIANLLENVRQQREGADSSEVDAQLAPFAEFLERQQIIMAIRAGEYERARKYLSDIIADDPDNSFALFWLSKIPQ